MSQIDYTPLQKKLRLAAGAKTAVTKQAFDYFKTITPQRSGRAKNSTRLNNNRIEANYPYASVLDAGRGFRDGQMRGSTQALDGMTRPTIKEVDRLVRQYIKKAGA